MGVLYKQRHIVRNVLYPLCRAKGLKIELNELEDAYKKYSVGKLTQDEFNKIVPRDVEREFLQMLEIDENVVSFLNELRGLGWKVGIVTNMPSPWARYLTSPMKHLIDLVVVSGDVGARKPDKKIFLTFLERSGASAHEVVFVDDQTQNVETAASLGMKAVLALWRINVPAFQSLEELKKFLYLISWG